MIDHQNRLRMKAALVEPFSPPRRDLEARALAGIGSRKLRQSNSIVAVAAFAAFLALAVAVVLAGRMLRPTPEPVTPPRPQVQVPISQLEARPLSLPQLATDGTCVQTTEVFKNVYFRQEQKQHPFNLLLYGTRGPIYGEGGSENTAGHGYYYHVSWLSDASYDGNALVRGRKLDGPEQIVFAGPLATGKIVTTDTINGSSTRFYSELAIPAAQSHAGLWRQWQLWQGVPTSGCYAFQVDGPDFEQVVVVYVAPGG